jgi:hypothetical protein
LIYSATRREVLRALFSASIGCFLPASNHDKNDLRSSVTPHVRPDFRPVRSLILQAIAHGKATGVPVAVAHAGSIFWETGFGWANREARIRATAINDSSSKASADKVVADIVAAGGKAEAIQGDFSKPEDISKVYAEIKKSHKKMDVLVNSAGVYAFGPIDAVTPVRPIVNSI